MVLCLLVSLLQGLVSKYFTQKMVIHVPQDKAVICADCGRSYVKITAATACPGCGSHRIKSNDIPKPDNLKPCAYCGTRYIMSSQLTKCPHCGRMQPQEDNRLPAGALVCPRCKRVNPKGALFCSGCAEPIGIPEVPEGTAFCAMCGEKIPEKAQVCPYCKESQ